MIINFPKALEFTLSAEGGFVDDPRDPGGATNEGITLYTLQAYVGSQATVDDLKNISPMLVDVIYYEGYWQKVSASKLPSGLDLSVFDMAVNAGVQRAIEQMQTALGVSADGDIGPMTLNAALHPSVDLQAVLNRLATVQEVFYKSLTTFGTFGIGWSARVDARLKAALALF